MLSTKQVRRHKNCRRLILLKIMGKIQEENPPFRKKRYYVSVNRDHVVDQLRQAKRPHQTFGQAEILLPNPTAFLKAKSRQRVCQPATCKERCCQERRPPVPRRDEIPKSYPPSNVDFLRANAHSLHQYHRTPGERKKMDDKTGHITDVEKSGLVPCHMLRKDFGKIPKYLKKLPASKTRTEVETHATGLTNSHTNAEASTPLAALQELRRQWTDKESQLAKLSICRAQRRETIEDELRQIERHIRDLLV